jgi:hypothetical protein
MSTYAPPSGKELGDLLKKLLGRAVAAKEGARSFDRGATAVYVDSTGTPRGYVCFELPLAACAGAALVMLPGPAALKAVKGDTMEAQFQENFYEVVNVLGRLFNTEDRPHVVLKDVLYGAIPAPALGRDASFYDVDITGYTKGRLSVTAV